MFHQIFKKLEVRQMYSAARRIFNSLLDVWKCRQTRSLVIDILRIISFRLMDRNETETFFIMKNVYLKTLQDLTHS